MQHCPLLPVAFAAGPEQWKPWQPARRLAQFTGASVAGTEPYQPQPAEAVYGVQPASLGGYRDTAFAPNPAVPLMNQALATGQAPDDIAALRAKGWLRGKIMGQRVDASGVATASVGHNPYGGVTAVGDAYGQLETSGRYLGDLGMQGHARAAAATTQEAAPGGYTVLNGAAGAQAAGSIYGNLPSGRGFAARGSASAQAEGSVMYTDPSYTA